MTDGDPNTYARYQAWSWNILQARSDEMWIWLTLTDLDRIKGIRIRWRDSVGRGTMYAEKFYVAVSPAEDPGPPPLPPVSSTIWGWSGNPGPSEWTYINREASISPGGGLETVELDSQLPVAQHVLLWLEADADDASLAENFAISELEVLLAPNTTGPDVYQQPSGPPSVCGIYSP